MTGLMTKSKVKKPTHKNICQAVASISAHLRCGNKEKANEWSHTLMKYMKEMGLLTPLEDEGVKKKAPQVY